MSLRRDVLPRVLQFFLSRRFAQGTCQVAFHAVENAVNETPGLSAAESFGKLDRFVDRNNGWNVVAIKHFVDSQAQDVSIDSGDAMELVILAVTANTLIDLGQVLDHSFDKGLSEFADAGRSRTKLPEIIDSLGRLAALKIAPEMILNGRFTRSTPFPHKLYLSRNFDKTLAISTAARAASVPRLILFSRHRSWACDSLSRLRTALTTGTP